MGKKRRHSLEKLGKREMFTIGPGLNWLFTVDIGTTENVVPGADCNDVIIGSTGLNGLDSDGGAGNDAPLGNRGDDFLKGFARYVFLDGGAGEDSLAATDQVLSEIGS